MANSSGKVLCTCPKCSQNKFHKDGTTHQGLLIHPRTQRRHLLEASQSYDKILTNSLAELTLRKSPNCSVANQHPSKLLARKEASPRSHQLSDSNDEDYQPLSITHCTYQNSLIMMQSLGSLVSLDCSLCHVFYCMAVSGLRTESR